MQRMQENHGVMISLDKAAQKFLEESGCNEDRGARAVDACIHKRILPVLAKYILKLQAEGKEVKDCIVTCFNHVFSIKV